MLVDSALVCTALVKVDYYVRDMFKLTNNVLTYTNSADDNFVESNSQINTVKRAQRGAKMIVL